MRYHVLAVSGSLRVGSANTGLVRMAQRLAPADLVITHDTGIGHLPFYNADLDGPDAWPAPVVAWRDAVQAADALFLAVAEYNWAPSAVMKNAIDWVSRPPGQHLLQGKVITLVSAGGGGGGKRAQAHYGDILPALGNTLVTEPEIMLKKGADYVSVDGTTTDPQVEDLVAQRLANLLAALQAR